MNWISDEHKKVYSKAFSALCKDVMSTSKTVINKTTNIIKSGYDYINKSDSEEESESEEESGDYIDLNYLEYPDVLICLNREYKYITKIYVFDDNNKIYIKRKNYQDYDFINSILENWFVHQNKKHYPTDRLRHEYDNNSSRILFDDILFLMKNNQYTPRDYHPLC